MRASIRYRMGGRRERGAVLVEFALVFPLLVMLILGMVTAGLAYNQKLQITHAAREGARFAATVPPSQIFVSGTWAENVQALVVERSAGDLVAGQVCVSLVEGSPGSVYGALAAYTTDDGGAPCISGQTYPLTPGDDGLRAQVTVTRQGSIELAIFDDINFTMSSKATAKSEAPG